LRRKILFWGTDSFSGIERMSVGSIFLSEAKTFSEGPGGADR